MTELKEMRREDRESTRWRAALNIYLETILVEAQNPERQIVYWIEHSDDNVRDEFKCFSIHDGSDVTGYLQYSYFCEENIFFFEYLCLAGRVKGLNYNKKAMSCIEGHLSERYPPGFTVVFEVAHVKNGDGPWESDKKLVNYFCRLGFRKVEFSYRYPILQSHDGETSYPADLMVRLPDGRRDILTTDYRTIIRCLYFKHYLRWDRPFLSEEDFRSREKLISNLYWMQLGFISGHDKFGTSGDDKRSSQPRFAPRPPPIRRLLIDIFGERFVEFMFVVVLLLVVQRVVDNNYMFVPFVMLAFAGYCLLQNTSSSLKLFSQLIGKVKSFLPPL